MILNFKNVENALKIEREKHINVKNTISSTILVKNINKNPVKCIQIVYFSTTDGGAP